MWKFLEALKKEHNLIRLKVRSMKQKDDPERRDPKWFKYNSRLQRLCESYDRYSTDPVDFLKNCANIC